MEAKRTSDDMPIIPGFSATVHPLVIRPNQVIGEGGILEERLTRFDVCLRSLIAESFWS